jgi:hypothetical protein
MLNEWAWRHERLVFVCERKLGFGRIYSRFRLGRIGGLSDQVVYFFSLRV